MRARRSIALALCLLTAAFAGCKKPQPQPSDAVADQSYLHGMCYIAYESAKWNNVDYTEAFAVMNNLGVKSWRNWMHFDWVLTTPDTVDRDGYRLMRDILDEAAKYGFQVIGMNHTNYCTYNGIADFYGLKPYRRDLTDGSEYRKWLDDYETSWYTMAGLFPDVTLWEVDNEPTNDVFMSLLDGTKLSLKEKAEIFADMLFYAARGIRRANPDAQVIAGGLEQVDSGVAAGFTELLYDVIDGGTAGSDDPDDFFDCFALHPYTFPSLTATKFKAELDAIYGIIKDRDKPKKIYLTEIGWTESRVTQDNCAQYVTELYETAKQCPYIESIHYFRLLDDTRDGAWSTDMAELVSGLFYDPDPTMQDVWNGQRRKPGAPKAAAYAYQQSAGGAGDLTLMEKEPV